MDFVRVAGVKISDKNVAEIVREVTLHGWAIEKGRNHFKLRPPSGAQMVVVSNTPSDWRTVANTIARVRRIDPLCFARQQKKQGGKPPGS
jgi:hypothetical protein